jgi:hypothetical protein
MKVPPVRSVIYLASMLLPAVRAPVIATTGLTVVATSSAAALRRGTSGAAADITRLL